MNTLSIDGTRSTGQDVRTQNVTAAMAVSNIVKTSLGPVGLDKMLVDSSGEVTITNDGATILKMLDIEHPAAKVLVDLATLQDQEVGDGTTSVVILAAELLNRGNELVKRRVHATSVINGFRQALEESVRFLNAHLVVPASRLTEDNLKNAAKTSMSSKILNAEADHFADIALKAMRNVRTERHTGSGSATEKDKKVIYPVKAVNILKAHGRSSLESVLVDGYALGNTKASQGMPSHIDNAKIAIIDFNLNRYRLKLGVKVNINDPKELESIQQREMDITKERIQNILASGANVVLTTKGIDDLCLKYFVAAGAIAVRRVSRDDARRVAKATGGQFIEAMADMDGGEKFESEWLGHANEVTEQQLGDGEILFIKGCAKTAAQTVVLRGANEYMLDEMERSLHDALCVVKRVLESNELVVGGGAVEVALAVHLERFATQMSSKEQLAIVEYAKALLVIPKVLAGNAAQDATELVAQLRSKHATALKAIENGEDDHDERFTGLDLVEGVIRNNLQAGVLEPAMSKSKSLKFATEAAMSIMRIDDVIDLNPSDKPGNAPRQ